MTIPKTIGQDNDGKNYRLHGAVKFNKCYIDDKFDIKYKKYQILIFDCN